MTFTGHLQYSLMTFANDTFIILYLKKKNTSKLGTNPRMFTKNKYTLIHIKWLLSVSIIDKYHTHSKYASVSLNKYNFSSKYSL